MNDDQDKSEDVDAAGTKHCYVEGNSSELMDDSQVIPGIIRKLMPCLNMFADGVLVIDVFGTTVFLNESFAEWSGYKVDTMNQAGTEMMFCPTGFLPRKLEQLGKGKSFSEEVLMKTSLGREHQVLMQGEPIRDDSGIVVGGLLVCRETNPAPSVHLGSSAEDADLRERLEEAARLCHELNQPIQVVMGYSEILLKGLSPEHPHHKVMQLLKEQMLRMSQLTKRLRGIVRKEKKDGYITL